VAAIMAIFDNSEIERRHSVYPLEAVGRRRSLTDTMDEYKQHAIALGKNATSRRAPWTARLGAADIESLHHRVVHRHHHPVAGRHLASEMDSALTSRRLPLTELGARAGRPWPRARDSSAASPTPCAGGLGRAASLACSLRI